MNIQVKSENKSNLERLERLAKQACDLGSEYLGRSWKDLGKLSVYTAENSNHQSFSYRGVEVSFHRSTEFNFTARALDTLPEIMDDIEQEIADFEEQQKEISDEERKAAKDAKVAALKQQIE